MRLSDILERRLIFGMWDPVWIRDARFVKEFIEKNRIEKITGAATTPRGAAAEQRREILALLDRPFPGGIRVAHLHLGDDIFLPTESQWKDFAGQVMEGFKTKLAHAQSVSFEQVMELSNAIETLG